MRVPFAAYLRVYEPLAAFGADEKYWRDYVASGRAISTTTGPGRQRELLYQRLGPNWTRLPELPREAYVMRGEHGPMISPWHLRHRIAEAAVELRRGVPTQVAEAFVPRSFAVEAARLTETSSRSDGGTHEHIAVWHVPMKWFVTIREEERELILTEDERILRYRVPMTRVRRRANRAQGILRQRLGHGSSVTASVRAMAHWLGGFHPRSVVELDYGGLVWSRSDEELSEDDSAALVESGLTALSRGDAKQAGWCYEQLMRRWRQIRMNERLN